MNGMRIPVSPDGIPMVNMAQQIGSSNKDVTKINNFDTTPKTTPKRYQYNLMTLIQIVDSELPIQVFARVP